jgi:uncharacterized protein
MKPLCIYHGNCADGFGAAWVVRKAYKEGKTLSLADHDGGFDFFPGIYQTPPPDVTDRHVVMVDFSYKRSVLLEMAAKAKSILIIDHHKTAMEDLVDLPKHVDVHFNMEHSGAMLTWMYFFPLTPPPRLLEVIEDRDLWRFKLGQEFTREVQACLFSFPYDFDTWTGLMAMPIQDMRRDGAAIERKHFKDIRELIAANVMHGEIGGHWVPILNVPYMWTSDAGHMMWNQFNSPFAACYWDVPDGRVFSLRSRPDFDCSAVAKQYGGGGHKNAAGFKVSITHKLARRESEIDTRPAVVPGDLQ